MKKKWLSLPALVCALCLLLASLSTPVYARSLDEIQGEIDARKEQLTALEEQINASQSDKEAAEAAVAEYQQNYDTLVGLIEEQAFLSQDTEGQLDAKTAELSATIASLQENRALYKKRLVAIYKINHSSAMAQVLTVESFAEFMQMTDALQRISERDTTLLTELAAEKEALEAQKGDIENAIARLTEEMAVLEANRDWASAKMSEMRHLVNLAAAEIEQGEEETAAAEHTPIVATASGTVITAEWHYSYGNYIVIDHGGGLRTLYAHCIELYIGAGASVATGDTIAGVGNTGNSFGAHLHFEVHDGGERQNPLGSGYLRV